MVTLCRFNDCNRGTTEVGEVDNGRGYVCVWRGQGIYGYLCLLFLILLWTRTTLKKFRKNPHIQNIFNKFITFLEKSKKSKQLFIQTSFLYAQLLGKQCWRDSWHRRNSVALLVSSSGHAGCWLVATLTPTTQENGYVLLDSLGYSGSRNRTFPPVVVGLYF